MNCELLHQLFEYKDGQLYWKNTGTGRLLSRNAGYLGNRGYLRTTINYKDYITHRLIFLMHHGWLPKIIDHIDGDKTNNNIDNLRAADKFQNGQNRKLSVLNTSGFKNVTWNKSSNKWIVRVRVNKDKKYFGSFTDLELADLVAQEARNKYHGNFANHGR